jgi:hypothetical protein
VTELKVDEITNYLAQTGWRQNPRGWYGAEVWRHSGDVEVLVPVRDGMGDGETRIRELLRCLSALEERPSGEIAREIAGPPLDSQFIRTFPVGHDSGYTSLIGGLQTVQGVKDALGAAARAVAEGPHFAFTGRAPAMVGDLLRRVELGPTRAGSYVVEVRVPTDPSTDEALPGRSVLVQLHEAIAVAHDAVTAGRTEAFDATVTAGVSADLCDALSQLSGPQKSEPFEISFRWAYARPSDVAATTLRFPESAGGLLQAAGRHLRGQNASGAATVTGIIEGLHDDPKRDDRWRVQVRGELRTEESRSSRRAVWVRLSDQDTYDDAIAAHRARRPIHASGELSSATGRVELVPTGGFDIT